MQIVIPKQASKWIQLFNGTDLKDWQVKFRGYPVGVNLNSTFRVNEGLLKVSYDDYTSFNQEYGHLFYRIPFSRYRLRAEYRFVGVQVENGPAWAFRNNGFMLHSQDPLTMGQNQDVPISIEAQLLGGRSSGERHTMNVCTPGTNVVINGELRTEQCISSSSRTYRGDEWVTVEMVVYADSVIHHIVEGDTVLTYFDLQIGGDILNDSNPALHVEGQPLSEGFIAIQAETHPTEFRKIELLPLD